MTILREEEHRALSRRTLNGTIVDLGGDRRSAYHSCIQGDRTLTIVNLDPKTEPDVIADLEQPLPLADASFDGVLLMNVLEHVFRTGQLLHESRRILKPGGVLMISVPYVFPYHASPEDYFRFSNGALERLLEEAGLRMTSSVALGSGVFAARYVLIERLFPSSLQAALGYVSHPLVRMLDAACAWFARRLGKQYRTADYALGFFVTATYD